MDDLYQKPPPRPRASRIADAFRNLRGWMRLLVALVSGLAAAFALPPIGAWPVWGLAVPALLLILEGIEPRRWRTALAVGWSFGFGYFLFAFHWIGFAFLVDAGTYLWMMPFAVAGLAAAMALYWAFATLLVFALGLRGISLVAIFAVSLAGAEWLRGTLFTGFPWAAPGLAVDGMGALAQTASLIGMTGLTLMVMLWAGLPLALIWSCREKWFAAALTILLPLGWMWGEVRLREPVVFAPGVRLRIVQPNIMQQQKWREDNARGIFDELKALSSRPGLETVTHLIWPETAVPFLIDESAIARTELRPLLGGRTSLITGSIRRESGVTDPAVHNSIIVFDGEARVIARYDKWRLVPGGEFLPFRWLLEPMGFRKVVTVPGSFAAGAGPATLKIGQAPGFGALICYEAIFPQHLVSEGDRPEWLVNVTNDGWFGQSTGPYQHLAQARLRTIEQGLPMARAANTGISAVLDAHGRAVSMLGLGEKGIIDSALPRALPPTLYARLGDWCLLTLMIALVTLAVALRGGSDSHGGSSAF